MPPTTPAVIELRRYTLHPGRRDELIELFDREFVETQEHTGIQVLGQFRDRDDPDAFVWLRGFPDMASRHRSLTAFYDGPVWARHRTAANATMLDSDNVLLLRPLPGHELTVDPATRAPVGTPAPDCLVVITVNHRPLALPPREPGPTPLAILVTEPAPNTFPRLPVRTDVTVAVTITSYPDPATHHRSGAAQEFRLTPTGRSLLR